MSLHPLLVILSHRCSPMLKRMVHYYLKILTLSFRDKATDGLKRLDAKASGAINLIQSGSQMFAQAHKDFICYMLIAMGKEHVDNVGLISGLINTGKS
jgi:hypothetical protein